MQSIAFGPGAALGKYRLVVELGRRHAADVYLAVARGADGAQKLVVLEVRRGDLAQDPAALAIFLDEARLAARLGHLNVAQTHEAGCDAGHHFLVMEYVDGQPLQRMLQRLAPGAGLSIAAYVRILSDALAGLHHAHELIDWDGRPRCVVHGALSPERVFVTYGGNTKLASFNADKAPEAPAAPQAEPPPEGQYAYMAPEQARAEVVDRRADVFAVGAMLWEIAVGRRLWKGLDAAVAMRRLAEGAIPDVRLVQPGVHPGLARVITRATAPRLEARYPTALAMQADLLALLPMLPGASAPHDVGAVLAGAFADERARLRALIAQAPSLPEEEASSTSSPRRATTSAFISLAPTPTAPSVLGDAVRLEVRVTPTNARLSLDGKPLSIGPFIGRIPRDGRARVLRIEAPGYEPWGERIRPTTDLTIAIALFKEAASPPTTRRSGGVAT
jgi:serine/threonine-protein kinase